MLGACFGGGGPAEDGGQVDGLPRGQLPEELLRDGVQVGRAA